jgi:hypothetical protein
MREIMKKNLVTQGQQSIDSQGASAMADGVKMISSPEEKTSSRDKIATDSKSAKNSSNKKATGLMKTRRKVLETSLTLNRVTQILQMKKARLLIKENNLQTTTKSLL